jgi:hypothetical protein
MLLKQIPIFITMAANLYAVSASNLPPKTILPVVHSPYDCTLNANCIIITEAGIVKITLSITAEDCALAQRGIWEAAKGFLKAF